MTMLADGNSSPDVCVRNLLRTVRGEVPYERIKGISAETIDTPFGGNDAEILEDASWLIETYESRVDSDSFAQRLEDAEGDVSLITEFELADDEEEGEDDDE